MTCQKVSGERCTEEVARLTRERDDAREQLRITASALRHAREACADLRAVLDTAGQMLGIDVELAQDLVTHVEMLQAERDEARLDRSAYLRDRLAALARAEKAEQERDALRVRLEEASKALRACLAYIPGSEVRNWPPGFRLKADALRLARASLTITPDAVAAARVLGVSKDES
jgi:chromosome segregation ATPase